MCPHGAVVKNKKKNKTRGKVEVTKGIKQIEVNMK